MLLLGRIKLRLQHLITGIKRPACVAEAGIVQTHQALVLPVVVALHGVGAVRCGTGCLLGDQLTELVAQFLSLPSFGAFKAFHSAASGKNA